MTTYKWKIFELTQSNGFVSHVEGNWKFRKKYDYSENLTEHQVSHWLDLDTQEGERHLIKDRLAEQLKALDNTKSSDPPWKVETFKVKL